MFFRAYSFLLPLELPSNMFSPSVSLNPSLSSSFELDRSQPCLFSLFAFFLSPFLAATWQTAYLCTFDTSPCLTLQFANFPRAIFHHETSASSHQTSQRRIPSFPPPHTAHAPFVFSFKLHAPFVLSLKSHAPFVFSFFQVLPSICGVPLRCVPPELELRFGCGCGECRGLVAVDPSVRARALCVW